MKLLAFTVFGCFIVTCAAIQAGDPCTPYWQEPCGKKTLLSEKVHSCTDCNGSNVCKTVTTYRKHFYSYVYEKKCYYRYWYRRRICRRFRCVRTDSCNIKKNVTVTEYHCCEGFTSVPTKNYHYHHHKPSPRYLKKYGCPRVLQNSTLDCLEELGLKEFASLFSGLDLEDKLGSTNDDVKFTVFAPPNELITSSNLGNLSSTDLETVLGTHVIKRKLFSVRFYNGQKKRSLSPGRFIHVTEIYKRNDSNTDKETIFINGNEITIKDACIAKNGIVHVIEGIINSSNSTIAEIVQNSSELTALESLLVKAKLLKYLKWNSLLTLFAPTDAAFRRGSCDLGLNISQCLLANGNRKRLKTFLKYHIVCGAEYSKPLVQRDKVTSQACYWHKYRHKYRHKYWHSRYWYKKCNKIPITVGDDAIGVGTTGAVIKQRDIPARNGVIHHISLPLVNPRLNLTTLCAGFTADNCDTIN